MATCNWCKGTGEECGCGEGYCVHCNKGAVPDWPFGLTEELIADHHDIFSFYNCQKHWENMAVNIQDIAIAASGSRLTEEDAEILKVFHADFYRNINVGTFCAMVVCHARTIAK